MGSDQLWIDSFGFVYSADGKRMLKGANVEGAYWIPEGVEEIDSGALIGCKIGTLHVPRSVRLIGDFVFGPGGGKIIIEE
jgi:hypothetical protein